MALTAGTYVADDADLGLVAYGGTLSTSGSSVTVQPRDAVRRRIFIGPLSVLVSIDAGAITQFSYNASARTVSVTVAQQSGSPTAARTAIWVESRNGGTWTATGSGITTGRGGWILTLGSSGGTFQLSRS